MRATNHLHHEDGSFQEFISLDADYLTVLPDDVDPVVMGPVLCAGLTAYKVYTRSSSLDVYVVADCLGGAEYEDPAGELVGCCWGWWWSWTSSRYVRRPTQV